MYFVKTPSLIQWIYKSHTWKIPAKDRVIYLTFDDGPDPRVTPDVLKLLQNFHARATFFCVGDNAIKYPEILKQFDVLGHKTGNHSFSHMNGRKSSTADFISDIYKAKEVLPSHLFRPPYGQITQSQSKQIRRDFRIVMWTVLPGDFDPALSPEKVLSRAVRYTKSGTIIVFHDNFKFRDKMLFALEGFLKYFTELNYKFEALTEDVL